ncbi:MAG TPA: sigma 54-interacting transcriptional regulator [Opitutaceae bacterium]|nr:sigma 54-interacting transcriptional regulator [Opitutaceae bacterium]
MDSDAEDRFDPQLAINLLLEIAQKPSLEEIVETLKRFLLTRPGIARIRMWLVDKTDNCLHTVAEGVSPLPGAEVIADLDDPSRDPHVRIPLGAGLAGKIALTGKQIVLRDLDRDPAELSHVAWLKPERIRGFNGVPLVFKGEVLGVIAVFSRHNVPAAAAASGRVFADYVAGAIAHARAFEEIKRLKLQLEQQNAYLQEEVVEAKAFGTLVGQSAALQQVVSQIDMVAPTDASVLITGETGTGKELVAHEIHQRSSRRGRPLIRVNCASIPKELFESEFFGHVKGAFTGAVKDRAGRFEAADGGTLFLDEIGEVPLDLQAKLLRVLQEKRYERVGEDRTRRADVRIVGATNRDLKREAAAGRFREDLYYRLSVFPIQVAPLRDRKEDIPPLAKHFIDLSVRELRCPKPRLTRAGVAKLQGYDWPGNVRELRNVIDRAVILARGGALDFDLPGGEAAPRSAAPLAQAALGDGNPGYFTESEMRARERDNLLAVLEKSGWKIKGKDGAAELLGIKPTTLISRVKKLGLKRAA